MAATTAADDLLDRLERVGYHHDRVEVSAGEAVAFVVELARSLGELYVPPGCDPAEPVLRTAPTADAEAAPFDRPEAIGWHGDFASHDDRPELSLVLVTRPDPRGPEHGAWRLASVTRMIDALRSTPKGREAFDLLSTEKLPFSYTEDQEPVWYQVLEHRPNGRWGLRFYQPSIERGYRAAGREVPPAVADALGALGAAADSVAETVPTRAGSLLVTDNWFALHDRTDQTVGSGGSEREALLCFVRRRTRVGGAFR